MVILIQPGLTGLSIKRGCVFGKHRDMPITTARILLATVTIMKGKGESRLMAAVEGLCRDGDWMKKHGPEVERAARQAAKDERERLRDGAEKDIERLRRDCERLSQEAMRARTENHTLRRAIQIVGEEKATEGG